MEIKYLYLVLGISWGIIIGSMVFQYVEAQTVYCDRELFIFLIHNDLEGLIGCVNAPDIQQDTRLEIIENRIGIINANITTN